jgi:hypothetical protein
MSYIPKRYIPRHNSKPPKITSTIYDLILNKRAGTPSIATS